MEWGHDQLAEDLAAHLRAGGQRLTWCNIALGGPGEPRPDVYALRPFRYGNPEAVSYEIKVSVSDFRRDITAGKWQKYLGFSQGVTFAVPGALGITLDDIPKGCGLIVRGPNMWRHLRKPTLQRLTLGLEPMLKLISARPTRSKVNQHNGTESEYGERSYVRREIEDRLASHARKEIGRRLGKEVAEYLRAPEEAKKILDRAKEQAETIIKAAKSSAEYEIKRGGEVLNELRRLFELPADSNVWDVEKAVRERAKVLAAGEAVGCLLTILEQSRGFLDDGLRLARLAAEPKAMEAAE